MLTKNRLFCIASSVIVSLVSHADSAKPNIIFILADDLGWTDAAVDGSRYHETPNIDRLASQGMRFRSFHTAQNCAPTRAALMTGQYAPRTNIYNVGKGGGKGSLYEGGTRAPFIVRLPGKVKPGTECEVPTIHVDVYPTLLDFARAPAPAGFPLDGESLAPLILGSSSTLKRDAIFQHFPNYLGAGTGQWRSTPVATIISGDWKLMEFMEDKHIELYNLRNDIGENTNLVATQPEQAKILQDRLHAWQRDINAPVLKPNQNVQAPSIEPDKGKKRRMKAAE